MSLFRYDTYNDLAERREAITNADANATERKALKIRNAILRFQHNDQLGCVRPY